MSSTPILVRVQAKGGKFLGPDAGYSQVTLRNAASGDVLAQGIASGGSGNLLEAFNPSATRQAVVTTQSTGAQSLLWLSAMPPTLPAAAGLRVSLDLAAPTLVQFTAESLTNDKPNGHSVTQTMWVTPGADLGAEPGVVLVIPGLIVNVLSTTVEERSLNVTAWVTMMCGCKIDPTLPWLPTEFAVTATVTDAEGNPVAQAPLTFDTTSTFTPAQPIALPGAGTYTLAVSAVQPAEGNAGSASTTITVP
ncbi:MAG TPA: hypothetical protein VFJ16_30420 [Longimicrobium sp.]|nr:hypothetical protein [Longimicrobium sp.]